MTLTAARQVADAVLYEGYLLYPYRASSSKNQVRWQFGILGPGGAGAAGVGEAPQMSTEVVVEPQPGAVLDLHLRFLQVQSRVVEQRTADGWAAVDELLVGGTRWIPFHEAVSREIPLLGLAVSASRTATVDVPAGQEVEELYDQDHRLVGRLVRTRWALEGAVTVAVRAGQDPRLVVVAIRVDNHTAWSPGDQAGWTARDVAARYSFVGTHLLATVQDARFVSLVDGPDWADADTSSCAQERCWPVLIDATEIDEILTLRVMTMTEQEKAEARGTDPRAAAILDRCDSMSEDTLQRMHGGRRPSGDDVPVYGEQVPWWDADEDARAEPETDVVLVEGVPVAKGSRVLLRPSRQADAQDLFLAGLVGVVAKVYFDVDGRTHVAVMLEDDPGIDLYGATGRFYYFGPEEIEPLQAREDAR